MSSSTIDLKTRKFAKINGFKGVDLSSSKMLASETRAVSAVNLIYENGVNRKRHGWIEQFRIKDEAINGIFALNLDEEMFIVYAGTSFYKVTETDDGDYTSEDITLSSTFAKCKVDRTKLKNSRIQMFACNGKYYFIGMGDFLVYAKYTHEESKTSTDSDGNEVTETIQVEGYELRRVENDEDTYIPTTSINLSYVGDTESQASEMDDINILSNKIKNTFKGTSASESDKKTFQVDTGVIDENSELVIEYIYLNDNGESITEILKNDVSATNKTIIYDDTGINVGSIDFENGCFTLNIDTSYSVSESNMTVTFSYSHGLAERITNCNFGVLFGVEGSLNTLFLSGNEDYPNFDFYSGMEDFTYFESSSNIAVGLSDSKIMGYSLLGDDTLAIHKQDKNNNPTIYYRTGSYETTTDDTVGVTGVTRLFPTKVGTIGESMVSPFANANLGGDKLFLSKNGVYGIVLSSNSFSTERFARERSQYIHDELIKYDLSEAVAIVFDNRYYLAVDDKCFVADGRITSTNTSDLDSYNYEWFMFDNMPVRVWAVLNDKLYFGTDDGRVCTFDDEYSDRYYEETSEGDFLITFEEDSIAYNKELTLSQNEIIKFISDVYGKVVDPFEITKVEGNKIYLQEDKIMNVYNGLEVYADIVGDSGLELNTKYVIANVDFGNCCFELQNSNEETVSIADWELDDNGYFRLSQNLKKQIFYIELDNESGENAFKVKKLANGEPINLVKYNESSTSSPLSKLMNKSNVCSLWKTPIFDFGTNAQNKTLLGITISTEINTKGQVEFGYVTKKSSDEMQADGVNCFNFSTIDFNNFTFDASFASSYTISVKEDFNFIQFYFKSENEYDSAVHSITATYKINSYTKGVQ